MKSLLFITVILFCLSLTVFSQEFGRGILLDDKSFENVPKAAPLMRGDYLDIPSKFSLRKYAPTPGHQGQYATCAGWACGYSARTILYSIKNGLINPLIDINTFSPSFIYNQIRKDTSCTKGVDLVDALEVLKDFGALKFSDFNYDCDKNVEYEEKIKAGEFKIMDYRAIFSNFSENKVLSTKKSISEYKPVVIAMDCPDSFMKCDSVWVPDQSDYQLWSQGHAIVVIGYDDEKYGGAFEVINSWGTGWGDEGFGWIRYSDFKYFSLYGFELTDDIDKQDLKYDLSGSLLFRLNNGDTIKTNFNGSYFEVKNPYESGTKFELRISNYQPAYVYCLSADFSQTISKIFPFAPDVSPLLPYKENNIAIPDENSLLMLDEVTGKTYFCFIYTNRSLDIDGLIKSLKQKNGNFPQKIKAVLKNDLIEQANILFSTSARIEFKAKSEDKSIVLVLVEFDHI